jgi:serine kinase of HPr protein (carbohydrate metabolism regulator)
VSEETIHAGCVALQGCGVLISGRSGRGKSDLALRLIDRGAMLVSDDYTILRRSGDHLVATAPASIAGKMEVRGVGIFQFDTLAEAPVALFVDLNGEIERLPRAGGSKSLLGIEVPMLALSSLEGSAPIKVEMALNQFGLKPR